MLIREVPRRLPEVPYDVAHPELFRIDAGTVEILSKVLAAAHDVNAGSGLTSSG